MLSWVLNQLFFWIENDEITWIYPAPKNSPHQDDITFLSRESQPKLYLLNLYWLWAVGVTSKDIILFFEPA